tara:strand:+ start:3455 stop:3595 length:141 start_codon:yes stop_codon:yes gene_type:complete
MACLPDLLVDLGLFPAARKGYPVTAAIVSKGFTNIAGKVVNGHGQP